MAEEVKQGAFVIRKIHSAYLVSVLENVVFVNPIPGVKPIGGCAIVASTMQMVGNAKLLLHRPEDACGFLMDYYRELGWQIEIAD
ncbi:MAG: hypothetical protein EON98_01700 [Chitinophagaceae bacterium]|nr:MAG: hypothetical protein EON98_01700 [Chitinophagaceae bacterium]